MHCSFGLQDVRWNALVVEELQGFRANLQRLEDAFGKHTTSAPCSRSSSTFSRLNPGAVAGAGLFPLPLAPPARPELRVLEGAPAFDLDATPREVCDTW